MLRARVTAEQLVTFNSRGGAAWLRDYLNYLAKRADIVERLEQ